MWDQDQRIQEQSLLSQDQTLKILFYMIFLSHFFVKLVWMKVCMIKHLKSTNFTYSNIFSVPLNVLSILDQK